MINENCMRSVHCPMVQRNAVAFTVKNEFWCVRDLIRLPEKKEELYG